MIPRFFDTVGEAAIAALESGPGLTIYVRESDFDSSLPNQWAVAGYPCEELGDGWEVVDEATLARL